MSKRIVFKLLAFMWTFPALGTPMYMAPEISDPRVPYDFPADVWALLLLLLLFVISIITIIIIVIISIINISSNIIIIIIIIFI